MKKSILKKTGTWAKLKRMLGLSDKPKTPSQYLDEFLETPEGKARLERIERGECKIAIL